MSEKPIQFMLQDRSAKQDRCENCGELAWQFSVAASEYGTVRERMCSECGRVEYAEGSTWQVLVPGKGSTDSTGLPDGEGNG